LLEKQGRFERRVARGGNSAADVLDCNTRWTWWMDRPIATSMVESSNVRVVVDPKSALFVQRSLLVIAMICKRAASKSRTQTASRIVPAAKVSRHDRLLRSAATAAPTWLNVQQLKENIDSSASTLIRINNTRPASKQVLASDFASINEGYRILLDPKLRLQHLLKLEGVAASADTVPETLADVFP